MGGVIGWDFRAAENWRYVRGMKWLMYHPRDVVIPLEASLFNAVLESNVPVIALRMPGEVDGHNRPLSEEEKEWHMVNVAKAFQRIPGGKLSNTPRNGASVNGPHHAHRSLHQQPYQNMEPSSTGAIHPGVHEQNFVGVTQPEMLMCDNDVGPLSG